MPAPGKETWRRWNGTGQIGKHMHRLTRALLARKNFDPEYRPAENNAPATTARPAPSIKTDNVRRDAVWRGDILFIGRHRLASIESDPIWPGMWRAKIGDHLTDLCNRTRAKDAALTIACAERGACER
jgi:hypothetical protein